MIRIVAIGIMGAILTLIIRPHRPDIAMLCALATGAIILLSVVDVAAQTIDYLRQLSDRFAVDTTLFSTMLRVTGIAYIAEFAVQACKDAGEGSIASKIELGAKVLILGMCAPLVMNLLEMLTEVLP
jgi:stage III sporulation protein AD